jgi:putative membrane-bound dehydrogenase-like protein
MLRTLLACLLLPSWTLAQGFTPDEALKRMKPAEGLEVTLVAAEPLIRQPVTMTFDDRGRLWVIQYLQYPAPAGLKPVAVDQYLRTKYDRVPEPPPKGPKGLDRVTILSDPDATGRYQKAKDFVTGLNIASGLALGHGGAFVLQAPYLLFYPDKNGDDVPDADPEVLLTGFGLEDAHAVGNSLIWGPDGWLYGAQGSTVTAKIKDPVNGTLSEFQQGVWRYHPRTKKFELFAEGGGNTWGLDFDRHGQLFAGTNWGGYACFHMVQGGYYVKGFAKHGPLHHPYAYGYFDHVPCQGFRGGHVTCGGIVYQGDHLPDRFRDHYLACNLLDNNLYWYSLKRNGSTYTSKHEGTLLQGNDTWFRPIDVLTGPDGCVYIADWYDKRANHVDPVDNWDRTNGRIYRLSAAGKPRRPVTQSPPLSKRSGEALIDLLKHTNSWQRSDARRILSERQDAALNSTLEELIQRGKPEEALEALWTLYASGGWSNDITLAAFKHNDPTLRSWAVRFIGDDQQSSLPILDQLQRLAGKETEPQVRSQLLSSIRRLPTISRLMLLTTLWQNDNDAKDPHLPLLHWWLAESLFPECSIDVAHRLKSPGHWSHPLVTQTLANRIARRFLAGDCEPLLLSRLLAWAPKHDGRTQVLAGIEQALRDNSSKDGMVAIRSVFSSHEPATQQELRVQLLANLTANRLRSWKSLAERQHPAAEKEKLLTALAVHLRPDELPTLMTLAKASDQPEPLRLTALGILEGRTESEVQPFFFDMLEKSQGNLRRRILAYLTQKPATANQLLDLVAAGKVTPKELSLDQVQRLAALIDDKHKPLLTKHWGAIRPATPGEKAARIRSVMHMLGQGRGDVHRGAALFKQHCAACHTLFGDGGKVGPDLTTADRTNRELLASHIVDPHRVIRPEFSAFVAVTKDGRTLTGLVVEETPNSITLADDKGRTTLRRDDIEELKASDKSLMAEGLLDQLNDQQIRDLFAYLEAPSIAPERRDVSPPVAPATTPASTPNPRTFDRRADAAPLGGEIPNTSPLTERTDFADKMVAGLDRFLMKELDASVEKRKRYWKRDTSSPEAYVKSVEPIRRRLREILGMVDERHKDIVAEFVTNSKMPRKVAHFDQYEVYRVRWRAFADVYGEGLILHPKGEVLADVIALPDADESPEQLAGLLPGIPPAAQFARQLAEHRCRVVIPTLISRADTHSGNPAIRMTNQPHREWLYRQAFEMGRHPLGYEAQKVLAAVDFMQADRERPRKTVVAGHGEGGMIALLAGAVDQRIDVVAVSGYFGPTEQLWREPIYRNIFGLLREFGGAELISLVAPRPYILNGNRDAPTVPGPPHLRDGRSGAAPGRVLEFSQLETMAMIKRYGELLGELNRDKFRFVTGATFDAKGMRDAFLRFPETILECLGQPNASCSENEPKYLPYNSFDLAGRQQRQLQQLVDHTQSLFRRSQAHREKHFWAKLDKTSLERYTASTAPFRKQFEEDVIGKLDHPRSPPKPRSRFLYEEPTYTAHEVELDVIAPDVIAYGWLLLPKDIKPNEKRPVVVCQHGLEGRPADVADPKKDHPAYHRYACRLAEKGYVVFAPQNPYIFGDRFRLLQRKANPLGLSLFSFITAQHRQITDWLASLPFVDEKRIAFYGLSYGGKTAMRVPALVDRYCLSICSADFNEWIWKNVSIDNKYSYMFTHEWEMPEWNLGHTFNYAEMAALIAPRPFMVERGHHDNVAPDEQVAYEYAKVRRLYVDLKIPDRTTIEFFNGPHTINGVGTFEFLDRHLKEPRTK